MCQQPVFINVEPQSRTFRNGEPSVAHCQNRLAKRTLTEGILAGPEFHAKQIRRRRSQMQTCGKVNHRSQAHVRLKGGVEDIGQLRDAVTLGDSPGTSNVGLDLAQGAPYKKLARLVEAHQ